MNIMLRGAVSLVLAFGLFLQPAGAQTQTGAGSESKAGLAGDLTFERVIAEVLLKSPELRAFSLEVRAREAATLQAGLWDNPQLQVQSEDIAGTGNWPSYSNTQTTVQINQWIRLGGKIAKRERVAGLSRDLAEWDYEIQRMNVLTRTGQAFVDVLRLQEQKQLAEDLLGLARSNFDTISSRVESGKVSPIEEVKAKVAMAKTKMHRENFSRQLESARRRLSSNWGERKAYFARVQGDFYSITSLTPYDALLDRLEKNPVLGRWATEMTHRQANADYEESKAIPDIQFQGAYRRKEEQGVDTLVLGLTIPLNIFDRNQGGIAEAFHRREKAQAERQAVELRLQTVLAETYNRLAVAHQQVTALKSEVLPGAQTAFDAVQEGYRFGKFGLLDVLDSQRTLFESRSLYLQALGDYHKAVLDIERLIGEPLSSWITEPKGMGREAPGE